MSAGLQNEQRASLCPSSICHMNVAAILQPHRALEVASGTQRTAGYGRDLRRSERLHQPGSHHATADPEQHR